MDSRFTREAILNLLRLGLGKEADLPETLDWGLIHSTAQRLGVSALVFDGYINLYNSDVAAPDMPSDIKKKWIAEVYGIEKAYLRQWESAKNMASSFTAGGIKTYVLKGFVLAECYPVPNHRRSVDLDCFLMPISYDNSFDAWEEGNQIMERAGLKVDRSYYKNSSFRLPGLLVENHRYLTPFRGNRLLRQTEIYLQSLFHEDEGLDKIDGTEMYRPPVLASALFIIEHAYSHFLPEGLTMRHLIDWILFRQRHSSEIDWTTFDKLLDVFGLRRFYEAFTHVGEFIVGDRSTGDLNSADNLMLESVWKGMDVPKTLKGVKGKVAIAAHNLKSGWKYRYYSTISLPRAFWNKIRGFIFLRTPGL